MSNLLSYKFWFNLRPGSFAGLYQNVLIIFVLSLIVLAVIFAFIKSRNKKNLYRRFWNSLYFFSLTNAIVGGIILFFAYEMVPFLSARFWFLLCGVEMLVWLFFIAKELYLIPKKKNKLKQENEYKKYIP